MTILVPNYVTNDEYVLELVGTDQFAHIVRVNGVDVITLETFWREMTIACGSLAMAEQLVDDEVAHALDGGT